MRGRKGNGLGAIVDTQFGQDFADVMLDGSLIDGQLPGNLAIRQTLRHQLQHFKFTRRQRLNGSIKIDCHAITSLVSH